MTKKALVEYFALRLAMVNDIKRKAYDKLSQEIDDKPNVSRSQIQGSVCN